MTFTPQTFPSIIIALNIGAAFIYGASGDYRMVAYWIAAAVLTASVTF